MTQNRTHTALALAGGNALGAYAAGAYEALHERGYSPDVIAGASIGAVTGAIIAGNPFTRRVEKLREFWSQAALGSAFGIAPAAGKPREMYNLMHVLQTLVIGRPGLFKPRAPGLASIFPGMPPDVALFDNKPLVSTLQRVVDFDRLNAAAVPLIITAVDVESGESVAFDTRRTQLETLHFLATTAFAPAFPPVEIDGRMLGDPGLVSNLPLDALLDPPPPHDTLCFAVDLFDAHGARPYSLDTALERAQDIVFSTQASRTLEARTREHELRRMIHELSSHIPPEHQTRRAADLAAAGRENHLTVVLIAYRPTSHEVAAKTIDFSRASIDERWSAGLHDMNAALDKLAAGNATERAIGYTFYDARTDRHAMRRPCP
jgi:NTE family protein